MHVVQLLFGVFVDALVRSGTRSYVHYCLPPLQCPLGPFSPHAATAKGWANPTGSHVQVLLWANYSSTSSLDVSFPQRVAPSHLVLEDSRLMCLKCFSLHLLLCSGASEHRFGFFFERSGGSQLFQSVLALGARAVSPPSDSLRRIHGAPRCLRTARSPTHFVDQCTSNRPHVPQHGFPTKDDNTSKE